MKLKIISLLAVLAVAAASFLLIAPEKTDDVAHPLLYPELMSSEKLNAIDNIKITTQERKLTLVRNGGQWRVEQAEDYPASMLKVREVLMFLSEARKVEAKTAKSEYYSRLNLLSPDRDEDEQEGSGVLLEASANDENWKLIIGTPSKQVGSGQHVRNADMEQSWLVDRRIALTAESHDWLLPQLIDIPRKHIKEIIVMQPETKKELSISREAEDTPLKVTTPSETAGDLSSYISKLASAAEHMKFKRLLSSAEQKLHKQILSIPKAIITYETYQGLKVSVNTYKWGGTTLFSVNGDVTDNADAGAPAVAEALNEMAGNRVYEMPYSVHMNLGEEGIQKVFAEL